MSDLITNNLDFGTGDTYKLQDARVDSMYTNAQIDSAMGNKVDKVSGKGLSTNDFTTAEKTKLTNLTQPNNSTITIRQGGVVKGTFTVDSAQDITIDIDAGGGVDAYTKAESDARYPSKTYFDADKINVSDSSYKIELGYNNEILRGCVAIGEDNTVSNNYSNILIGYFNNCLSYMDSFDGVIIGYNNDASNYDYNVIIGSKIYNSVITQNYEVVIGYQDKPMSVKPSGEVYSRGDVTCDDGSGNRVSLRSLNPKQGTQTGTSDANGNLKITTSGVKIILFAWDGQHVFIPFYYGGNWYVRCQRTDLNGSGIANTQFTVNYYYI